MARRKPSRLSATDLFCGAGGSSIGAEAAGVDLRMGINHWVRTLLTALPLASRGRSRLLEVVALDIRRAVLEGRVDLPRAGEVRGQDDALLPFAVVDSGGAGIEVFSVFLRDLMLSDASRLTCRSYAYDLLRWWRVLTLVEVSWEQATRSEVELLVGWLRSARNRQRDRRHRDSPPAGTVNLRTGKRSPLEGYAPSTINHALSVVSEFYAFHLHYSRGPAVNPVPAAGDRRLLLAHRSPMEPQARVRRAPLRQRIADRSPRSIPDELWDELFASMETHRDRALLAFYVSSGARASELLGLTGGHVDWAGQRIRVVSKGSRTLDPLPASPEAFHHLALYFDEHGSPAVDEPVWRTRRGQPRPLTYTAMRRVLQRANAALGTNWTLHDLRHTAAARMAADPQLTLSEVQTVLRHRHLSTTERYLRPRVEEMFDKLAQHYSRPSTKPSFPAGYDAEDVRVVFGG